MKGELIEVWGDTWREIWSPLFENADYGQDLMMDIYRELFPLPQRPDEPDPKTLNYDEDGAVSEESQALIDAYKSEFAKYDAQRIRREEYESGTRALRPEFNDLVKSVITTEIQAKKFLRSVWKLVVFYDDAAFSEKYFSLVTRFLTKFSIRYELRRPFHVCPTLPGIFTKLIVELRRISTADPHLNEMMSEFEDSIRDLNIGPTSARIKSLIQKQVNLIEAIGATNPNVTTNTIGAISDELTNWPHERLKESLKKLYGFTCDYPGIRHAGTPANRLRDVDLKDAIAVSVLITGFIPYLVDQFDPESIYFGQ